MSILFSTSYSLLGAWGDFLLYLRVLVVSSMALFPFLSQSLLSLSAVGSGLERGVDTHSFSWICTYVCVHLCMCTYTNMGDYNEWFGYPLCTQIQVLNTGYARVRVHVHVK